MNLEYMKVSLFEMLQKKKKLFHDIIIFWDAPAFHNIVFTVFWSNKSSLGEISSKNI